MSLCWLSGLLGSLTTLLASSIRLADLSMTSRAASIIAFWTSGSSVVAATPRTALVRVRQGRWRCLGRRYPCSFRCPGRQRSAAAPWTSQLSWTCCPTAAPTTHSEDNNIGKHVGNAEMTAISNSAYISICIYSTVRLIQIDNNPV